MTADIRHLRDDDLRRVVPQDYLPTLREQRHQELVDRMWLRIWRYAVWPLAMMISAIVGYNLPHEPRHVIEGKPIAYGVQMGKRKCAIDIHEGCLTCEFKTLGETVRSTHC